MAACTLAFPSLLMPDARSYFRPLAHQAWRKAKSRSSHPTPSRHSQKFPFKPPLCKQTCAWGAFVNTNKPYSRPLGVSRAHLASGCSSGRSFQIHSMNPMAASTSRCNSSIIREPCAGGLEAGMERQTCFVVFGCWTVEQLIAPKVRRHLSIAYQFHRCLATNGLATSRNSSNAGCGQPNESAPRLCHTTFAPRHWPNPRQQPLVSQGIGLIVLGITEPDSGHFGRKCAI